MNTKQPEPDNPETDSPMRFCSWYPLAEANVRAPAAPGIFQVRLSHGLITYPRGKSAMIHYGYADDLKHEVDAWAVVQDERVRSALCRHISGTAQVMAARFDDLVASFVQRFGKPPGHHG